MTDENKLPQAAEDLMNWVANFCEKNNLGALLVVKERMVMGAGIMFSGLENDLTARESIAGALVSQDDLMESCVRATFDKLNGYEATVYPLPRRKENS